MVIIQIIIWPKSADNIFFILIAIGLFLINYLIVKGKTPGFGKVVDSTGKPLSNITFQVYDAQWNKLITVISTDTKGQFEALLTPKDYYIKLANQQWRIKGRDSEGKFYLSGKIINNTLNITQTIT